MVALSKARDIEAFLANPHFDQTIFLIYGPDEGLVTERADASLLVRLARENRVSRVVGVDGQGRASNIELTHSVYFTQLHRSGDGFEGAPAEQILISREFSFDPEDVLARTSEEAYVSRGVVEEVVRAIMLRLTADMHPDK